MSLPITVVGAGDNLVIPSTHAIANLAWTIAPSGIPSPSWPVARVYDAAFNGAGADFDFTSAYAPPTPYVALYFGSSTAQLALTAGVLQTYFGASTIYKTAQDFAPAGVAPVGFGVHRIYASAFNGASVDFDFTEFHALTAKNLAFYFGTTSVLPITQAGAGDGAAFGLSVVYRNYIEVTLSGWDSLAVRVPRAYFPIYNGASVDFYFSDSYAAPTPYVNLYFGTGVLAQIARSSGINSAVFGTQVVANACFSAAPAGTFAEVVATPRVYPASTNGAAVNFDFVAAPFTWNALNVPFYFVVPHGGVFVRSINFTPLPQPIVTYWQQNVRPLAWTYHQFGYATAYTLTQYVFPYNATPSSRFGTPSQANVNRTIYAWGGQPSSVVNDDAEIELRARILTGVSAGLQVAFGTQYVADYYQVIRFVGAFWSEAFGTAKADWLVRTLYVQPSADPPSVMPPMVGRHVSLYPEGFQSSAFGTFIAYNGIPVWPSGWRSSAAADTLETRVRLQWRLLPTQSIGAVSSIDHATIYNLDQYVLHINGYDALDWATYGLADVQNFIKTLRPFGWRSDRFAFYPADLRQPYQVIPATIAPPAFDRQMISHWVRYLPLEGIDSYVPGRWIVVWKHAKEVYPTGIASEAFVDRPESVVNRNRRFRMHWVLDSMEFGTAMVAYRVRRVYHWFPYQGSTFPITLDVRENPHPVFVTGWDQDRDRHAAPYVEEHFTIIHPWGKLPAWREPFNTGHAVANRNRSYTPSTFTPLEQDRYGRPRVELWIRNVYPQGKLPDNVFGVTDIRDNKQYPSMVPGLRSSVVPVTHKVEYTSITPYITRKLFATGLGSTTAWGTAVFPRVQLFPTGISAPTPPQPVVKAMSIFPKTIRTETELDMRFGLPFIAGPQWITNVKLKAVPTEPDSVFGKPQMAHWTVWCRFDAPEQARQNHDGEDWALVDGWKIVKWDNPLGQFGNQWVSLKNRRMYHWTSSLQPAAALNGGVLELFGGHMVTLKHRRIYASGRNFLRVGIIDIPTSPRTLYHFSAYFSEGFGTTRVQHPEEVGFSGVARASGWKSHEFGTNAIELFNRTIGPPAAFTSDLRYGQYVDGLDGIQLNPPSNYYAPLNGGQPPVMPGPTRVGFPIKRQMTGIAPAQEPQAALVAYRIRNIYPVGSDMLQMRSRLLYGYNSKMRVWKAL